MLLAVKFWALAHLLANGMLADVVLFGAFSPGPWRTAFRVKRRSPGPVPALPASAFNDGVVIVGGLLLYVGFALWLHPAAHRRAGRGLNPAPRCEYNAALDRL